MKRRTVILTMAGLLTLSLAGIAFAFGGANDLHDAYVHDDSDTSNNGDVINNDDLEYDFPVDNDGSVFESDDNDIDIPPDYDVAQFPYYMNIMGIITEVEETEYGIRVTIEDNYGNPAILILTDDTVFPYDYELVAGETVTGWYAANAPMIAIWPAQYNIAVLVAGVPEDNIIKVDRFNAWADSDEDLMISQDGMLAFRMDENTKIILANGDDFTGGDIEGRRIVVMYNISTRSIPEIATATKLIVLYEDAVPLT